MRSSKLHPLMNCGNPGELPHRPFPNLLFRERIERGAGNSRVIALIMVNLSISISSCSRERRTRNLAAPVGESTPEYRQYR